jgi:hypothetical protein
MATDLQGFSRTLFAAADQLWTNSALIFQAKLALGVRQVVH